MQYDISIILFYELRFVYNELTIYIHLVVQGWRGGEKKRKKGHNEREDAEQDSSRKQNMLEDDRTLGRKVWEILKG